jgi:hypothetical protein
MKDYLSVINHIELNHLRMLSCYYTVNFGNSVVCYSILFRNIPKIIGQWSTDNFKIFPEVFGRKLPIALLNIFIEISHTEEHYFTYPQIFWYVTTT